MKCENIYFNVTLKKTDVLKTLILPSVKNLSPGHIDIVVF